MTETTFAQKIQEFEQAYQTLITSVEQYPVALQTKSGACGEWSAREVLAHMNGWLVEAQRRYPRYAKGTGQIDYNIDAFNEVSVWLRDSKGFEQILDELRQLSSRMVNMAQNITPHYLERDTRYAEWLVALRKEAEEHSIQLCDFLETHS